MTHDHRCFTLAKLFIAEWCDGQVGEVMAANLAERIQQAVREFHDEVFGVEKVA